MAIMNRKGFDDFIYLPNILIKCIGYDLSDNPKSIRWTIFMRLYLLMAILSHLYCSYFIARIIHDQFTAGIPDLSILLRLISGFNYVLCAFIKSINFIWFFKEYKKCCQIFDEIFPKTARDYKLYQVEKYFWPKWIKCIIYLYLGSVGFIILSPLGEGILFYVVGLLKHGYEETKFGYNKLYEIPYSFDHHSPMAYIITYAMEVMHGHFIVICNICPDVWLLLFSLQLCMHFDSMGRILLEYTPGENDNIKDDQFLASLVEQHLLLLE